jgi:hypothetical protein
MAGLLSKQKAISRVEGGAVTSDFAHYHPANSEFLGENSVGIEVALHFLPVVGPGERQLKQKTSLLWRQIVTVHHMFFEPLRHLLYAAAAGTCGDDDDDTLGLCAFDSRRLSIAHDSCAIAVDDDALDPVSNRSIDHITRSIRIGIENLDRWQFFQVCAREFGSCRVLPYWSPIKLDLVRIGEAERAYIDALEGSRCGLAALLRTIRCTAG